MLQKEFFQVQPFNPNPYWDPVIVNLSGAQKFEEDTVFVPGKYRIEVAPGHGSFPDDYGLGISIVNMIYEEEINEPFIVRAYCGGNPTSDSVGINPYSGPFKVNGKTAGTQGAGTDVNHIFGAGAGSEHTSAAYLYENYAGGGGNCLGNGATRTGTGLSSGTEYYGAGSCLHLLPVGGIFGTDYIRAYHAAPYAGVLGGAYGGGQAGVYSNVGGDWAYRGGNSPYGNGGSVSTDLNTRAGKGIGGGGKPHTIPVGDTTVTIGVPGGAYFNGANWIDVPGYVQTNPFRSRIRITYLGPLD